MYSIIVVPPPAMGDDRRPQIRLAPGERLAFGRSAPGNDLAIPHEGVARRAGAITAQGTFWLLSNLSAHQTYVVAEPEGAGEHIKVGPGRLDAPVPFEFSRIVLPAAGDLLALEVWAPRHDQLRGGAGTTGDTIAPVYSVDRTKRYFAVLAALCEPRLRGDPHAPLPTVDQVVERLRPGWPAVSRTTVQWNIGYLGVKLRLDGKKESLVSLALRFDVVREDDLTVLTRPAPRTTR
ncbi:FHA domain-containing protein [Streptomyces shenzhenensis]|uniref:FHA domain-containing protein n=1 Tax=Streptomyces shenzhenensis TaxID=943815 RepID=UPI0016050720|nr:FHA domain-containing protein [Streptomyces shenzhenensis]